MSYIIFTIFSNSEIDDVQFAHKLLFNIFGYQYSVKKHLTYLFEKMCWP